MAKAAEPIVIAKVLQKQSQGEHITLKEAQAVVKATSALRNQFNNDMFIAMQNPSALQPGQIDCIIVLASMMHEHGFFSDVEILNFQEGIRMLGR